MTLEVEAPPPLLTSHMEALAGLSGWTQSEPDRQYMEQIWDISEQKYTDNLS